MDVVKLIVIVVLVALLVVVIGSMVANLSSISAIGQGSYAGFMANNANGWKYSEPSMLATGLMLTIFGPAYTIWVSFALQGLILFVLGIVLFRLLKSVASA